MNKDSYSIQKDKIILKTSSGDKTFKTNTQEGCTLEILIENINKKMLTKDITDRAAKIYKDRTSKEYRERTGRAIRKLREKGFIARTGKGTFVFTGEYFDSKSKPFPKKIRDQIIKRDNYTCQGCGITQAEGALLTADHIQPQDRFGPSTLENGMCLCTKCENIKSNYGVRAFGKKMFQKYLTIARKENDKENIKFFGDVLGVFKKHGKK